MKRILSISGIFLLAILFLSSFSLRENPQDPPRGKKGKKHLQLVTIDEDGKKTELDTIIEGDNVFVWNGDTLGGEHEFKWVSDGDFDMDFDIDVEETADGKIIIIIIMKSGKDGTPLIHEFIMDGGSHNGFQYIIKEDGKHGDHDVMIWKSKDGNEMMLHSPPGVPHHPHAPNVVFFGTKKQGNVIDLSDPGIISYDKKELKDGKAKITIIRNKPVEENIELHEEIIMQGVGDHSMMIHKGHPGKTKTVKVIKSEDGNIEIIEDGEIINIKEGSGDGKFITENGNVYIIKETKTGNNKKVEVRVETEKEVEKEEK